MIWGIASYKFAFEIKDIVKPLQQSYRITIPLRRHDNQYYWYSHHSTALRIDKEGNLIAHLNSYYYEGKWSEDNLRPFEACICHKNEPQPKWEALVKSHLSNYILDQFTNTEIDLMHYYTKGFKNAKEIAKASGRWTVHTIRDYNKQILAKGNKVFKTRFKDARSVAEYCSKNNYLGE